MTRSLCLAVPVILLVLAGSSAAPVPKTDAPPVKAATLQAALGRSHLSKEVRAVTRALGTFPELRSRRVQYIDVTKDDGKDDEAFDLAWKTRGVEMACVDGQVKAIFLHNEGADGFARYPGELPDGLSFGDNPDGVERKLGKAEKRDEFPEVRRAGGKPQDELWLRYPSKGLWVSLQRLPGEPYTVRSVSIQEPSED